MKNYLVIGYANYEPKDRINYENSLKYFGYNYKIVGDGEKWINFIESKIRRCYEYVKALKSNKPSKIYDIIICTDCFDVLATRTPDMLIRAFDNLMSKRKKRIVIGMENVCGKNCVPITTLQNKPDIYFKSVNGGFYIGYRKDMLKMWKTMLTYGIDDDQRAIGKYVNENPDLFYFDTKSRFVGNVHRLTHDLFRWDSKNSIPYRIDTNMCPYFLHFPGWWSGMGLYIDDYGSFLEIEYQGHNFTDLLKVLTDMGVKFNIGIILIVIILIFIISYFFSTNHVTYGY